MFPKLYKTKLQYMNYFFYFTTIFFICSNCATFQSKNTKADFLSRYTEVSYYMNGEIESSAEYVNGKLDGISKHWSKDGILISESEYNNGKPHGRWIKFHKNQTISYETNYFYGKKHGEEKWYYENGQIKSEQTFKYGIAKNNIIRWDPDGTIIY